MTNLTPTHKPVLLNEVLDAMNLESADLVVDGTLGLGGYSEEALNRSSKLRVIAFELDEENLAFAKQRLSKFADRISYINDNFGNLEDALAEIGVKEVDGIMLDLGLSSPQIDVAERGFSFMREGALDMRFGKMQELTAAEVVNTYPLEDLSRIFREYGEEKSAWRIANAIFERRKTKKFETTTELADMIADLFHGKKQKIHPATRIFQALRIEVNKELEMLENALKQSLKVLKPEGRLAVVAYHSLEDRIVKNFFRENAREYVNLPNELTTRILQPPLKIVFKKPITPTADEIWENPRSRSAKLRVAEKI
jgi:16S rRNA (cytosine1402-N4)-methyltransferase